MKGSGRLRKEMPGPLGVELTHQAAGARGCLTASSWAHLAPSVQVPALEAHHHPHGACTAHESNMIIKAATQHPTRACPPPQPDTY